jgi:hypothetical protein
MPRVARQLDPYYHQELLEAFRQPGCAVCRLSAQSAEQYFDAVLWELVNDSGVRSELNQARGYCQQHGWLLDRAGAALGTAILLRGVVKTLLDAVEANPVAEVSDSAWQELWSGLDKSRGAKATAGLVRALSPQSPCPVCARVGVREQEALRFLLTHLDGPEALLDAYRASDGLCLDHVRKALAWVPSEAAARTLVAAQREVWQRLHGELGEFIRKNDQRFRDEAFGAEKDAWRRALEAISGPPPRSRSAHEGLF